jgi:hypothetical protein
VPRTLLLLSVLVSACTKPADGAPDVAPAERAETTASAITASPRESAPPESSPDSPAPALARALAGDGAAGVFWLPVKGDFPDEDLLLTPDGLYTTHFDSHPGSFGVWRVVGDTLTLGTWLGDRQWVVRGLRVDGRELRGQVNGAPLVMRRLDPRRVRR